MAASPDLLALQAAAIQFDDAGTSRSLVAARVDGWGMSSHAVVRLARPRSVAGVQAVFELAATHGWTVGLRGAGRSYGDAALNEAGIVLDFCDFATVQWWEPTTGHIVVDPGVTIGQVWQHVVGDGWWPPVVSGTMFPTVAGAAAMNIHGKNNYKAGPIGDWIERFRLVTPVGEIVDCSRDDNADLFHAAISGFGMLGVMVDIELRLKPVGSGRVEVEPAWAPNLAAMFERFEAYIGDPATAADYCVGWIDAFGSGRSLGRGQIHAAWALSADQDPEGRVLLDAAAQALPDRLFGLIPKVWMWRLIKPFSTPLGMRAINLAKVLASRFGPKGRYRQSHAGFHFLLDYVPDWKRIYEPGGLIQFQSFVPKETALATFERLLRMQQERGLVNWLSVIKRHRPDSFLLTHALDGWSLAQDFAITDRNRVAVWQLCQDMAAIVVDAGGRFYPAKDSTLSPAHWRASHGDERLDAFVALKARVDPDARMQTNLSRRLFRSGTAD